MDTGTTTQGGTTTMARTVAVLPEQQQELLRQVKESGDLQKLRQRVYALRQVKWPLRAIGDPVDAPRSTVRMWETGADPKADLPSVPECPRAERDRGERVVRFRMDVPPDHRQLLKELAEEARQVRGRTPSDAPARIAADRLDKLIEDYIARGVPVKRIATHMGVTPRAVAARHERYNERKKKSND